MDQKIYETLVLRLADLSDSASAVSVKVYEGVVTLKGTVASPKAREQITEIARSIADVRSVDSRLALAGQKKGGPMRYILGLD